MSGSHHKTDSTDRCAPKPYSPPLAIPLGSFDLSHAYCGTGSSARSGGGGPASCTDGSAASDSDQCSTGNNATGQCLGNGSSATVDCANSGVTAVVACTTGTGGAA